MRIFRGKINEAEKIKELERLRSEKAADVELLDAFKSPQFLICWNIISKYLTNEKLAVQSAIDSVMCKDINANYALGRLQTIDRLLELPEEIRASRVESLSDVVKRIDERISQIQEKAKLAYEP